MTRDLVVESRQLLRARLVEVGGFPLWVRAEEPSRGWDLEVTRPILEGDEYELEPLRQGGHAPRFILDVGAHVGAFTLKAKRFWPQAEVVAVEPDPDSAALFRLNTAALDTVTLHEAALLGTAEHGEVHLRQAGRANEDGNSAASQVLEVVHALAERSSEPTAVVRALGLLELLARHGDPTIDLLKLDCEAAEAEILESLAEAGRMADVGWIRGEWHFEPTVARLEAALGPTHTFHIHRGDAPWGAFIAHRTLP